MVVYQEVPVIQTEIVNGIAGNRPVADQATS